MGKPITKRVVRVAAQTAVEAAVAASPNSSPKAIAARATEQILADPVIQNATTPISRLQSQTIQGIVVAAAAPLVMLLARKAGVDLAEGDGAVIVSSLITLAGAAYAWWGRETTSRPLA